MDNGNCSMELAGSVEVERIQEFEAWSGLKSVKVEWIKKVEAWS